jgi:methionyl-tRNA formyltransferase
MSLKVVFMGTPSFSVPILKAINNSNHKIVEVYSQPPNKKNRGLRVQNSAVHDYAHKLNIPVRCPIKLDDESEINHLKKLKPDLVVVVAYGKILPEKLLNIENLSFLNVHASLLPRWRGAAPIQRAIMMGDKETGISIMKIVPKLDAGPILIQSKLSINNKINYEEMSEKMSDLGAKLIIDALELIKNNKANFTPQDETKVVYAKKIAKIESKINWNESAEEILAKIRAFYPNPGTWFELNGKRIKITKAIAVEKTDKVGTIIDPNKMIIACKKNALQILELKKEGKKLMQVNEFIKGNKIKIGQILS